MFGSAPTDLRSKPFAVPPPFMFTLVKEVTRIANCARQLKCVLSVACWRTRVTLLERLSRFSHL